MSTPRFPSPPLVSAAVACVAAAAVWFASPRSSELGFRIDDAWIHLVYARSLWEQGLLAYNDGVPATGATSPLWALLLSLVYGMTTSTDQLVVGVHAVGTACFVGTAAIAATLGQKLGGRAAGWLAGTAVALCTPLAAASFSGMEVGLASAALVLAVYALQTQHMSLAGLAFAVAVGARPEAGLVWLGMAAIEGTKRPRALLPLVVPVGVLLAVWASFNVWATGSPLPATFHMKADAQQGWGIRLLYVAWMLLTLPTLAWGAGLFGLVGLARWQGAAAVVRGPLIASGLFLAGNTFTVHHVDRNFYHLRYLLPAIPLLIVGVAVAWCAAGRWLQQVRWLPAAAFAFLCGIGFVASVGPQSRSLHNEVRNINEVQRAIGVWLHEHSPPGGRVAVTDAGAIRYFSERPVIDLLGLNTPEIVWEGDAWARDHPVVGTATMPAWVWVTTPDVLVYQRAFRTPDYTVTSAPDMDVQAVHGCRRSGPVRFDGVASVQIWCDAAGEVPR